jgi:phage-related minor tail protein
MTAGAPGPLGDEAAKLVEAIGEWARGAAGGISMSAVGEGAECQVCPFCQLMALVRRTNPETFGHLADASASMIAALRTVVEKHDHQGARTGGVERIDLDEREPQHTTAPPSDPAADVAT